MSVAAARVATGASTGSLTVARYVVRNWRICGGGPPTANDQPTHAFE